MSAKYRKLLITFVHVHCLTAYYHIALIFRESIFSRIAVYDNFVAKILQICCRSRQWCEVSKFLLKYFCEWHRIRENLDPRDISAIRYDHVVSDQ